MKNIETDDKKLKKKYKERKLVLEVRMNQKLNDFRRARQKLKVEELAENIIIKHCMDKVENDLGAITFILGSIREIEIKTQMLVDDQKKDIIKLKELKKNFKIFSIIMNRFDHTSPGQ